MTTLFPFMADAEPPDENAREIVQLEQRIKTNLEFLKAKAFTVHNPEVLWPYADAVAQMRERLAELRKGAS